PDEASGRTACPDCGQSLAELTPGPGSEEETTRQSPPGQKPEGTAPRASRVAMGILLGVFLGGLFGMEGGRIVALLTAEPPVSESNLKKAMGLGGFVGMGPGLLLGIVAEVAPAKGLLGMVVRAFFGAFVGATFAGFLGLAIGRTVTSEQLQAVTILVV